MIQPVKHSAALLSAIHSNRTVLQQGITNAYVLIEDGIIKDIVNELPANFNGELTDAGDKLLMPGVIDPHVHINEPGRTEWEGFETATSAAIAGGVTMLVDMPLNSSPVTTTAAAFDEKYNAAQNKLYTNVGFWGGLVPGNAGDVEALIKKGVLGFKAFLTHSGIDDFPNVTEDDLDKAMPIIAKHGQPLLVHCELTDDDKRNFGDDTSYQNYLGTRPVEWEVKAVELMIKLCRQYNCRTHIVHVSAAETLLLIAAAKNEGLPLTAETAQHYLYFAAETIPDANTSYKCAPPIRSKTNNDQLWLALKEGVLDFVATDHSPATPDLKETTSGNFMTAWGGIASIQFALPVLWTAAKQRGYTIEDVTKWLCEKPAALISTNINKGKITKGFVADLIIVDEEKTFTVTEAIIHHRHKLTPYLGETLYGVVEQSFLGGKKVYEHGSFLSKEGKVITA